MKAKAQKATLTWARGPRDSTGMSVVCNQSNAGCPAGFTIAVVSLCLGCVHQNRAFFWHWMSFSVSEGKDVAEWSLGSKSIHFSACPWNRRPLFHHLSMWTITCCAHFVMSLCTTHKAFSINGRFGSQRSVPQYLMCGLWKEGFHDQFYYALRAKKCPSVFYIYI